MSDGVATPHRTRPVEVLITEPLTVANRGEIARWLEDQGISVAVPYVTARLDGAEIPFDAALILDERRCLGPHEMVYGDRLVYDGARVQAVDQAHYKLWYEPVDQNERTEPT